MLLSHWHYSLLYWNFVFSSKNWCPLLLPCSMQMRMIIMFSTEHWCPLSRHLLFPNAFSFHIHHIFWSYLWATTSFHSLSRYTLYICMSYAHSHIVMLVGGYVLFSSFVLMPLLGTYVKVTFEASWMVWYIILRNTGCWNVNDNYAHGMRKWHKAMFMYMKSCSGA